MKTKDKRLRHPHPMQPIDFDGKGVIRFRPNRIVDWMLKAGENGMRYDLNTLTSMSKMSGFTREDWSQFAQLIGYSVSGWGSLSYVNDDEYEIAEKRAEECEP